MWWVVDLDELNPPPAGFPGCGECAYRLTGPWTVCYPCARQTITPIAENACKICSQALAGPDEECRNSLCRNPTRQIYAIEAISMLTGPLRNKIHRYKYDGIEGWGLIFGRLLLGHISDNPRLWDATIITANPTWTGDGRLAHTERVIDTTEQSDVLNKFRFDVGESRLLTLPTVPGHSADKNAAEKRAIALQRADLVHIDGSVSGHVVLYDDITTTGWQLEFLARRLLTAGATKVTGVVLARAPWRPMS